MAFRKRLWGVGKVMVLLAGLGTTYLLSAAVAMRLSLRAREVPAPTVVGLSVGEARARLAEDDLLLRIEDGRRVHPEVPVDHIIEQEPAAGLTTRRQRTVKVWLSAGTRAEIVPDLIGETQQTAESRLQRDAFELSGMSQIRSGAYPIGSVIAQAPAPQTRGSRVAVLVNLGEEGATYVMPDLIGVDGGRAAEVLRAGGLRVAVVAEHPYPGVPAGIVLRQHPQAGFQVRPGEPISLEVSR